MTTCSAPTHADHADQHGPGCGHSAVRHSGHVDYLYDGHLHHPHAGHVDEHLIEVSGEGPDRCTSDHRCGGHQADQAHGRGHEAVPQATTWIIAPPDILTTRMAITATTTVHWRPPKSRTALTGRQAAVAPSARSGTRG